MANSTANFEVTRWQQRLDANICRDVGNSKSSDRLLCNFDFVLSTWFHIGEITCRNKPCGSAKRLRTKSNSKAWRRSESTKGERVFFDTVDDDVHANLLST